MSQRVLSTFRPLVRVLFADNRLQTIDNTTPCWQQEESMYRDVAALQRNLVTFASRRDIPLVLVALAAFAVAAAVTGSFWVFVVCVFGTSCAVGGVCLRACGVGCA